MHFVKSVQARSFFWSAFSRIRTEYGEIRSISPYSVQMRESMDQKKVRMWTLFTQRSFGVFGVLALKVCLVIVYITQLKNWYSKLFFSTLISSNIKTTVYWAALLHCFVVFIFQYLLSLELKQSGSITEAATRIYSVKKTFLKISEKSVMIVYGNLPGNDTNWRFLKNCKIRLRKIKSFNTRIV